MQYFYIFFCFTDLDRTLQERKKLRSILSQDDMTKIDKGANIQPLSNDGTDEGNL